MYADLHMTQVRAAHFVFNLQISDRPWHSAARPGVHYPDLGLLGGAVGCGTALQAGRSRVRFSMESLELFIDIILPATL